MNGTKGKQVEEDFEYSNDRPQPVLGVSDEDRQRISEYLADMAREFRDEAPLKSSLSRALNVFAASGLTQREFADHMLEARRITKEHMPGIEKVANDKTQPGIKAAMAYWFAVLEDGLGLKGSQPAGERVQDVAVATSELTSRLSGRQRGRR